MELNDWLHLHDADVRFIQYGLNFIVIDRFEFTTYKIVLEIESVDLDFCEIGPVRININIDI